MRRPYEFASSIPACSRRGTPSAVCCRAAAFPPRGFRRLPGPPPPTQSRAQARVQQRAEQRAAIKAQQSPAARPPVNQPGPAGQGQPHIQRWLDNHKNLTPAEQEREFQNEPGFRELPPQLQQQELQRLRDLNSMPAPTRDRMLNRNEMLERMSPQQREQYRNAAQQLTSAPPPRRRLMAKAILDLRMMPPGQREQVIDSPAFSSQFSDGERSTIRTILTGEPYNPVP